MTKSQAIQSASYILGESIKEEFEKKEENAIAGGNSFFYVYNSEDNSVRIDIIYKDECIVYDVNKENDTWINKSLIMELIK